MLDVEKELKLEDDSEDVTWRTDFMDGMIEAELLCKYYEHIGNALKVRSSEDAFWLRMHEVVGDDKTNVLERQ